MKYVFDRVIDRRDTYSIKYDPASRGRPEDILPLWVADMDFQTPPCVTDALAERVSHGIYGYSEPEAGYFEAVRRWFERRFQWNIEHEWLTVAPGVVNAIYLAIRAFTEPGDGVVIQQPVYYPFGSAVKNTGRRLLVNELVYDCTASGRYGIDYEDFESKIKQAALFILCSPHNPVGRVWTRDELTRMGEICLRHNIVVISDEIHQDFVYPGNRHLVFAGIDQRFAETTVTCTSPSKTFNLAGLSHANIIISNKTLRDGFQREYANCGLGHPGVMGITACRAAYEGGEEWLEELLLYLAGNISTIRGFLQTQIPKIKLIEPEGTYLAWLDCSGLGFSARELDELVTHKAKLWLDDGVMFGPGGAGFQRVNAACPRSVLSEGLKRLESVFGKQ